MNKMNVLLIDKRVSRYEELVDAIDPNLAIGITFDYHADTFETIKARIIEALQLHGTSSSAAPDSVSVGLIQHNYNAPTFSMVASEHNASSTSTSTSSSASSCIVSQVETLDPNLETWTRFKDFIVWCKTECGAAHFDMMACALYSNPDWKYIIDTLAKPAPGQTGVDIRASTDDTGSAALGGDWFLESHSGVNLKDVYFTEQIETYRGVFGSTANHSLFISSAGAVYGTGWNGYGQLGVGNTINQLSPALISTNIGSLKIVAVSTGYYHSFFLTSTGAVYGTGYNYYGALGLGDTTAIQYFPTLIPSLTNVVAVSCGFNHSLFITNTGAAYSTGTNGLGQLGLGDYVDKNAPTLIPALANVNVVAISAGSAHSLFLTSTGAVYSTGYNGYGQLGVGGTGFAVVPTIISSLTNVVAISAGENHSLFLTSAGAVYGTGYNENGQLGLDNTTNQNSPTLIPALANINIVAISAGSAHSLFLTSTGAVYSTGYNNYGHLGLGDTTSRNVPTLISTLASANVNIVAISAGYYYSFFLTSTGAVYSAGSNGSGELGLGNTIHKNVPTLMSGTYYQMMDVHNRAPAKFVSVGEGTTGGTSASIVYSYDGINWSPSIGVNSVFSNGYGVTYNSSLSRWVAVGSGTGTNKIAYSYDGIYWVGVSDSSNIFSDEGLGVST